MCAVLNQNNDDKIKSSPSIWSLLCLQHLEPHLIPHVSSTNIVEKEMKYCRPLFSQTYFKKILCVSNVLHNAVLWEPLLSSSAELTCNVFVFYYTMLCWEELSLSCFCRTGLQRMSIRRSAPQFSVTMLPNAKFR